MYVCYIRMLCTYVMYVCYVRVCVRTYVRVYVLYFVRVPNETDTTKYLDFEEFLQQSYRILAKPYNTFFEDFPEISVQILCCLRINITRRPRKFQPMILLYFQL